MYIKTLILTILLDVRSVVLITLVVKIVQGVHVEYLNLTCC